MGRFIIGLKWAAPIFAPMPGRMPTPVPITPDRKRLRPCPFQVLHLISIESLILVVCTSSSAGANRRLRAKSPIRTVRGLKPSSKALMPNVSRNSPVAGAVPGKAQRMPRQHESIPSVNDLPLTPATSTSAMRTREK